MKRPKVIHQLETRFRQLFELQYNTDVPFATLDEHVTPLLHPDISFVDPWQSALGKDNYVVGMRGFHSLFSFHTTAQQLTVSLDEQGQRGSVLVDCVMHLFQQVWFLQFPLRAMVRYEFEIQPQATAGGENGHSKEAESVQFLVTKHEEMWSIGDMICALPLVGWVYSRMVRPSVAIAFGVVSLVAAAVSGRRHHHSAKQEQPGQQDKPQAAANLSEQAKHYRDWATNSVNTYKDAALTSVMEYKDAAMSSLHAYKDQAISMLQHRRPSQEAAVPTSASH